MDCKESRKRLRDYVENKIDNEFLIKDMEGHIKTCPVCKRELLMWQDVMEKRRAVEKLSQHTVRDRMKRRMKNMNTDPQLPRIVMQMQAVGRFMTNPRGCMMLQIILLLGGFLFYLFFVRNEKTPAIVLVLFAVSFVALIFLVFKKWKGK